jgi:integrase/recombinase XerD
MLEDRERRKYPQTAIEVTIKPSTIFANVSDQSGQEHIREYQAALFKKWRLAPNTMSQRLAALRLFNIQTLKKAWSVELRAGQILRLSTGWMWQFLNL